MILLLPLLALALPPDLRDAVEVGDCATVLAALTSPASDEERLAAGWCLDGAAAAAVLAPVDGVLAPYARWQAAEALTDAGRPEEALAALADLSLPGEPGLRVRLLRGRALVAAHRSLEAREDLRALLDTPVEVEARFWLAVGGEDRGDTKAAVATFERVWAQAAHGDWAERAEAHLGGPPDPATERGRALIRDRVATLTRANRHEEARDLLELLHEEAPAASGTPLQMARVRFRAKDYPAAVTAFASALGPPAEAKGAPDDLFDYAMAAVRAGDYEASATVYGRLAAQHGGHRLGDTASFKIGFLAYDRGRCDVARERFAEHVVRLPDSRHLDEALWFAARCAWKAGDVAAAERDWKALIARRPTSSLAPGARYWLARARERAGEVEEARAAYRALLEEDTGYAWFAAERLGHRFEARAPALPAVEAPPVVEALIAAGFPHWARAELDSDVAVLHLRAGAYRRAIALGCPAHPRLCSPRPERSIVERVAARYGLHPLLPYAIMKAESAYDPSVTSIAGARGLMQLMPEVAREIHGELYGAQPFDPDALYRGPYNASLGTAELGLKQRTLGDVLDGPDLPAVIATYNGGEEAVRRWLTATEAPPPFDEFTEDIGYTETRQYVKRVLGYLVAYRRLYGDP